MNWKETRKRLIECGIDPLRLLRLWGCINLRNADLHNADLCGVKLNNTDLRNADLSGANLRGANLHSADLRDADLYSASLCEANLCNADLRGANLDFSCWPLWCGSLHVTIDEDQAAQLAYHLASVLPTSVKGEWIDELLEFANTWSGITAHDLYPLEA